MTCVHAAGDVQMMRFNDKMRVDPLKEVDQVV